MIDRKTNIVRNIDWTTVLLYIILVIFGWCNIYAAVYNEEHKSIFDFTQRYGLQMMWILAAFLVAFCVILIDLKVYTFFAYFIYAFCMLLLVMVLLFGREINGNKAWLFIGKFSIQPSEFAKVATSLAVAKYLGSYNVKVLTSRALVTLGFIIFLPMLLIILEPDVGSLLVYFAFSIVLFREGLPGAILLLGFVCAVLLFAALLYSKDVIAAVIISVGFLVFGLYTRKYKETLVGLIIFGVCLFSFFGIFRLMHKPVNYYFILASSFVISGLTFVIISFFMRIKYVTMFVLFLTCSIFFTYSVNYVFHHVLEQHQQQRMNILLGLEKDPLGGGYNVNQSMIAIGSGGFLGKGYLQGTQTKYNFVPEQSTDFIFCTVGEEWGFLGSLVVTGIFLILLVRIVNMAERQRSTFSRVYAYCVASLLFFHFAINVGMTIGLLPVIGIPLPFFSYGGSSLWSFTILLFILIRLDASRLELLK